MTLTKETMEALQARMGRPRSKGVRFAEILRNDNDRTLIFGYTCNRDEFHVYMRYGVITRLIYNDRDSPRFLRGPLFNPADMVPDKRVYPETCDEEFCALLIELGVHVPFSTFNDSRPPAQFHGKTLEDFGLSPAVAVG